MLSSFFNFVIGDSWNRTIFIAYNKKKYLEICKQKFNTITFGYFFVTFKDDSTYKYP